MRAEQADRMTPDTPTSISTDTERIDDVDDISMPVAPVGTDKSPAAPTRTQSTNFAALGSDGEVRLFCDKSQWLLAYYYSQLPGT